MRSEGVQYHLEVVCTSHSLPSYSGGFCVCKSSGICEFGTYFELIELLIWPLPSGGHVTNIMVDGQVGNGLDIARILLGNCRRVSKYGVQIHNCIK